MLNDTLQAIYTAVMNDDNEQAYELIKGLNKIGMDTSTVKMLICELLKEGIIK